MKGPDHKKSEMLRRLYWEEERSINEIAKMFGVSWHTIRYWMNKFDIPTRNLREATAMANKKRTKMTATREVLSRLYNEEKRSAKEIGDTLGVSATQVLYWMEKYNIPRRSRTEIAEFRRKFTLKPEELYNLYWIEKKSLRQIGKQFDVDSKTVRKLNEILWDSKQNSL